MDSLIEKWKKTTHSGQRYSDQKYKQRNPDPMSSSDEEVIPKYQQQQQSGSAKKQSPIEPLKNHTNQSVKSVRQSHSQFSATKIFGSSEKKKSTAKPPSFSAALDTCTYNMTQLIKKDISQSQLIDQVKLILVEFAENLQTLGSPGYAAAQVEELQLKIHNQEQQILSLKNNSKEEISRKMIGELEDKLLESEKQRVKLKSQRDHLQAQIDRIQEQLGKYSVSQELVHQLRSESSQLRKNNDILLQQIQELTQKDKEQQIIWNQQVEDLIRMMDILKKQIQIN